MKVTKEQFEQVLDSYGRQKLTRAITAICEPPMTRYHDFSGGKKWPEGRVAYIIRNSAMPEDYNAGPDEYHIEEEVLHLLQVAAVG
jgi:hypothetical protein